MKHEKIMVQVTTIYPDNRISERCIDHADRIQREWLGKHAFWAMRNGVEIRTKPVSA